MSYKTNLALPNYFQTLQSVQSKTPDQFQEFNFFASSETWHTFLF